MLLMFLSVTVIFYSLSTVTNAVLQGIGRVNAPVFNAMIALIVQTAVLSLLLLYTDLGDVALCIVTMVYSFMMCVLNNLVMRKHIPVYNDIKKTYVLPVISAVVMGIVAFLIHFGFSHLFGLFIASDYFVNLIATAIAILAAIFVYFIVLIKSGGASEEDIRRFPKGSSIVRLLKKLRIL